MAVAISRRSIYVARTDGQLVELDARDAAYATVLRSLPHAGVVQALAANGTRLYVLDDEGLSMLELAQPSATRRVLDRTLQGRSIRLAGRDIHVVRDDASIATLHDASQAPQAFEVSISDDSFSPQDLAIAVGDTVRWTNVTGDLHNVVSCSPAQFGCDGASATDSFTSGPATGFWELEHVFAQAGTNPYVCQPHATFMTGSVTVAAGGSAPPGVSDGSAGAPMRVGKLAPDGSALSVSWDTSCSGAADYEILYGYAFGLPGSTGGGYELSGGRCALGTSSPFVWSGTPPAFAGPTGWVYWLVVATDGAATEGSWGTDGAGMERSGSGVQGSSDECGITIKNVTNPCGQ